MRHILRDVRYGLRHLIRMPGFAFTTVISLAIGIGATTAMFSVVHAILFDPYPYAGSNRMIQLRLLENNGEARYFGLTASQWQRFRDSPVVEGSFVADTSSLTLTGNNLPENVAVDYVSCNAFEQLGVPVTLGRGLQSMDGIEGQDPQPVVVLSYKFWKRSFNGDRGVIGHCMQLDHRNYTVVGVAGWRFTWDDVDAYVPMKIDPGSNSILHLGVRLKPGITHQQADSALQPLIEQFVRETPAHFPLGRFQVRVEGINEYVVHDLGGTLKLLFLAVTLLLLIGCGNTSIMLLARATTRQQEFAIRSAIGASPARIVAQLLSESLLLSLTGVLLGTLFASKALRVIVRNLPPDSFPSEAAIQINMPVLAFSVAVAIACGLIFGLWPAYRLARTDPSGTLRSATRRTTVDKPTKRIHGALIAGQIALTLLMLTGAASAIDSFTSLLDLPLGYDPRNVMSVGIPIHQGAHKTWPERAAYLDQVLSRVAEVRGVTVAAISAWGTPPQSGTPTTFQIASRPSSQDLPALFNPVSREYFQALRIPLQQGQVWSKDQDRRGAALAVVNQAFARRYFPNESPIGRSIRLLNLRNEPPFAFSSPGGNGWLLIMGVAADKRNDGLGRPIVPEVFVPYALELRMWTEILVRSDVPPLTLLHAVKQKVSSVDQDQQTASNVKDLEQWIEDGPEWARAHLISWLFAAFAALALILSVIGLFSVVSYLAVQRTHEFGIRVALGARRGDVVFIIVRSISASVGAGFLAGVILTPVLSKLMKFWIAGTVHLSYPLLLACSSLLLAFVAVLACVLPARRAAGVDPMTAVRYE